MMRLPGCYTGWSRTLRHHGKRRPPNRSARGRAGGGRLDPRQALREQDWHSATSL